MTPPRTTAAGFGPRVRAPKFPVGADWLNTTEALTLEGQRGRFVLLDFWTFCCANCLHVLDELRPLEQKHREILTVIGVHSPKFAHEAELSAVTAAVERYGVDHPVISDAHLTLWGQYAVRAWPTLVLIDPEGYVVAQAAGEGQSSALDSMITALAAEYEARGTLRRGDAPYTPPAPQAGDLRFPAKAILLPAERTGAADDSLLVADAGHHQLVELALDGTTVLRRIGTGQRGRSDGAEPEFAEPNGLALVPEGLADYDVVVADTANHLLRGVRLSDGAVVTTIDLAEAVTSLTTITGPVPPVPSPWDVAWWPELGSLVVAAAGVHLLLAVDLADRTTRILAGTTVEGLRDGAALDGWLAQPSGLAVDGNQLWFVDSETSSLRRLSIDGELTTAVGEGLFDFGHVDGPAISARFQHPLGLAVLADGTIAVADTYNGAIRRYDPWAAEVTTIAIELAEPSGALLVGEDLVVVESAAHRLVRPVPRDLLVANEPMHTERPATDVRAGTFDLHVMFAPAPGRKLDERYGPSTLLTVSASPPTLLVTGGGEGTDLHRQLVISPDVTEGVLHVTAQAASCDDEAEHPACYLARQDWGVPVKVTEAGPTMLTLTLLG